MNRRSLTAGAGPTAPGRAAAPRGAVEGFTLIELLVALTSAALLAVLLGSTLAGGASVAGRVGRASEAAQLRILASSLVRAEIELAGRGSGTSGLAVQLDPAGEGGDRIVVRYLADAYRAEPLLVEATFFAALDGRRRPSLYRQPDDGVRQPWLSGVTGLHVRGGRTPDGRPIPRSELTPGARIAALEVEVRFEEGPPVRGWASAARSATLSDAPLPALPASSGAHGTAP